MDENLKEEKSLQKVLRRVLLAPGITRGEDVNFVANAKMFRHSWSPAQAASTPMMSEMTSVIFHSPNLSLLARAEYQI